jgi:hypothetical protein
VGQRVCQATHDKEQLVPTLASVACTPSEQCSKRPESLGGGSPVVENRLRIKKTAPSTSAERKTRKILTPSELLQNGAAILF